MKLDILGTEYSLTVTSEDIDPRLKDMDGFCDETTREIVAENYQGRDRNGAKANLALQTRKVIRHEIIHAFLFESGLAENSFWAQNEEMVDWVAMQGPKLMRAWQEAGAL